MFLIVKLIKTLGTFKIKNLLIQQINPKIKEVFLKNLNKNLI